MDTFKEKGDMNEKKSFEWLKEGTLSGHMEGYLCAIEEQEIETKSLQKSREKDENIRKTMNSKCRLCHQQEETIFHVLGSCSHLSSSLYLHNRHNKVAKKVHEEITANEKTPEENNTECHKRSHELEKKRYGGTRSLIPQGRSTITDLILYSGSLIPKYARLSISVSRLTSTSPSAKPQKGTTTHHSLDNRRRCTLDIHTPSSQW